MLTSSVHFSFFSFFYIYFIQKVQCYVEKVLITTTPINRFDLTFVLVLQSTALNFGKINSYPTIKLLQQLLNLDAKLSLFEDYEPSK
jgi:hypothetical protein